MFKAFILFLGLAVSAKADVVGTTPIQALDAGVGGSSYGSLTYALNNALTGTSSSAIDLSGTSGLWLTLTSTGQANVNVYFSNGNLTYTTGASKMYTIQSPGSYAITPKSRYVSFYNAGSLPSARVSAFYYTVAPPAATVNLVPGGSLTANQGNGLPGGLTTNSWLTSDNYVAGYLTTTAAGAAPRPGSFTAVAITGTVMVNITTAAGVNTPCEVCIYPGMGPNAGFYYSFVPTSTWVAPGAYLAVSTTPICKTWGVGYHLILSPTAAALTVNAQVNYGPIY